MDTRLIFYKTAIYTRRKSRKKLLKCGKGIYPYEYITSFEVLKERELPPKSAFYSSLSESLPTDAEYDIAKKSFRVFGGKTIGDYTELYCKLDTLLLLEVILQFANEALDDFWLDITNYISLPQLSFDGMLKSTDVKLDYIPDPDMI